MNGQITWADLIGCHEIGICKLIATEILLCNKIKILLSLYYLSIIYMYIPDSRDQVPKNGVSNWRD